MNRNPASSPRADALESLFDRVLDAFDALPPRELALRLGVVDSYVSKLRSGWRPKRVRNDLEIRLRAIDPQPEPTGHPVVREEIPIYGRGIPDRLAGKQEVLMELMRWVVSQQAALGEDLRSLGATGVSPSLEAVEAGAAALRAEAQGGAKKAKKKPA